MDAFATHEDLAELLNRTFTPAEEQWMDVLLASASTYLREDVIGQHVYPQSTVTFDEWPVAGRVDLPQFPVVSIVAVKRDGVPTGYKYFPGYLMVRGDAPVEVTYTYGLASPPARLKDAACVLVSSALLTLESQVGLTAGGLSSVALDDFKIAWADAGASSGMVLPPIQVAALRSQFGKGQFTFAETGR